MIFVKLRIPPQRLSDVNFKRNSQRLQTTLLNIQQQPQIANTPKQPKKPELVLHSRH